MSNLTRQMHSDGKKRRSFLALLFSAGDLQRYESKLPTEITKYLYGFTCVTPGKKIDIF